VHPRGARIKYLHAVAAHVSFSRLRILCDDHRPRDVTSAILWPALQNRKIQQGKSLGAHHFLARAAAHGFRKQVTQLRQLRQHLYFVEKSLGRLHVKNRGNSARNFIERIHLERQIHAPFAANKVRYCRVPRTARPLEIKRRPARLHRSV
jgi:hypothetical protein